MNRLFVWGGLAASVVLIVFKVASVYVGLDGRSEVRDTIGQENIVGTEDSTIPGQKLDTGSEPKAFADVMRRHTLEAHGRRDLRGDGSVP
jgi:hypothetical protein